MQGSRKSPFKKERRNCIDENSFMAGNEPRRREGRNGRVLLRTHRRRDVSGLKVSKNWISTFFMNEMSETRFF